MGSYFSSIPAGIITGDTAVSTIKYSFLVGFLLFLIGFPCYGSRKSFWDALAARKMIKIIRTFIFLEMIPLGITLYYFATLGSPILLDQPLSFSGNGTGSSWTYGVTNPIYGIILIGIGFFGDIHPAFRITCILGCAGELFGNSLIVYQVYYYIQEIKNNSSPGYSYTLYDLNMIYWSNVVSIGMCTYLLMTSALLCCIVGWCSPQLIHPSHISGKDMDRCEVMRKQMIHRFLIEKYVFGIENDKPVELVSLKQTNISKKQDEAISDINKPSEKTSNKNQSNIVIDEESGIIF